jgi:hypothetical protein
MSYPQRLFRADHPSRVILSNEEWIELLDQVDEYIKFLRYDMHDEAKIAKIEPIFENIYGQLATGAPPEQPEAIASITIPELE